MRHASVGVKISPQALMGTVTLQFLTDFRKGSESPSQELMEHNHQGTLVSSLLHL